MANRRHGRRSGRAPGVRNRPQHLRPVDGATGSDVDHIGDVEFSNVASEMSAAMRAAVTEGPVGLLTFASTALSLFDPRCANPFDRSDASELAASRDAFLAVLLADVSLESSAVLSAVATLTTDDAERDRLRAELRRRGDQPRWMRTLGDLSPTRAVELVHPLGDGDNIIVGAAFPNGKPLTIVVFIDHNLSHAAKDAFCLPESIEQVMAQYHRVIDDDHTEFRPLDLADARARVEYGIDLGARYMPPLESDTWPDCRAVVELVLRRLPEGGSPYTVDDDGDPDTADERASARFLASRHGQPFGDDPDRRALVESTMWFATGFGSCDPLQWSPTRVEMFLTSWINRKVMADWAFLAPAPDVLRAVIRWAHETRGIAEDLTAETLDAVELWEPEFRRQALDDEPPPSVADLMSEMLRAEQGLPADHDDERDDAWFDMDVDPVEWRAEALDRLARDVGGTYVLNRLDTEPLPDEVFEGDRVPDHVRTAVAMVVELCDGACDALYDVEVRTGVRRLIADVAESAPQVFTRRGRVETLASAFVWLVAREGRCLGSRSDNKAIDLGAYFEVGGQPGARAATAMRAAGFDYGGPWTGLDPFRHVPSGGRAWALRRKAMIETWY